MTSIFSGAILKGSKRGTALGYPTINIELNDASVSGVYAARVVLGKEEYLAAAFADQKRNLLEAHILDFSDDVYGHEVEIRLENKIREAVSFEDNAALRAAIASDVGAVRQFFSS